MTKAKAFVRLKHVERKLSELSVPVYFTIKFGTEGTASTVPSDAEIVVSYISIEPFLSTLEVLTSDHFADAASVIKAIIDEALSVEIIDEFFEVQVTYSKAQFPGSSTTNDYRELKTEYITVADSGVESTVVHIDLTA